MNYVLCNNLFISVYRLLFRYCGADPLHGRTVFVDMLCKYRYEWIIANQSPEYPPLSEVHLVSVK